MSSNDPSRGPSYAACPKCQATQASAVSFTWWGGMLGPRLLHHVKCAWCGAKYNGKTGASNTKAIAIYSVVVLVIIVVAAGLLFARR